MSNVQVKNIDSGLHDALRGRADAAGLTISDYVLELIRRDLRRPARREWLTRVEALQPLGLESEQILEVLDAGRGSRSE